MYIRAGLSWASWLGEPQTTGWRPGTLLSCPVWGGGGALNQTESSAAMLKKGRRSLTSSVAATLNAEGGELPPASDQ